MNFTEMTDDLYDLYEDTERNVNHQRPVNISVITYIVRYCTFTCQSVIVVGPCSLHSGDLEVKGECLEGYGTPGVTHLKK